MVKPIDITGKRFSRLVVKMFHGHGKRGSQTVRLWECVCDCGKSVVASYGSITTGGIRSCGCLLKEAITTHGMSHTPVYKVWHSMLDRCRNQNNQAWKDYGGRGIKVCDRWQNFANFIGDMGERPEGGTIDRINVNGDYEPSNCRWISQAGNANNRRNNRIITHDGESHTLSEWARKYGLSKGTLRNRIESGWSFSDAISMKPDRSASNIATRAKARQSSQGILSS